MSEPNYYKTKNFSGSLSAKDSLRENHEDSWKQQIIWKSQQRFRSAKFHVFTEEMKKIASSAKDDENNVNNLFSRNISIWNEQRSSM